MCKLGKKELTKPIIQVIPDFLIIEGPKAGGTYWLFERRAGEWDCSEYLSMTRAGCAIPGILKVAESGIMC